MIDKVGIRKKNTLILIFSLQNFYISKKCSTFASEFKKIIMI